MFVAIIQARMGSSRLPNKVMREVLGKPLIFYLLERVKQAKKIDNIILATTTNCKDDVLATYVDSLEYDVYRGSEDDVLSRYYEAFTSIKGNYDKESLIVRITGDCPLIEPNLIDKVVGTIQSKKVDYVNLSPDFAEGLDVEVFTFPLLKKAYTEAKLESEREHVALFFHNNSYLFKMYEIRNTSNDSNYRITVDEPEDFIVVRSIIEFFVNNDIPLDFANIKKYLDNHKDALRKHSKIIRNDDLVKSLEAEKNGNI